MKNAQYIKELLNNMPISNNVFIGIVAYEKGIEINKENYLKLDKVYNNFIEGEDSSFLNETICDDIEELFS